MADCWLILVGQGAQQPIWWTLCVLVLTVVFPVIKPFPGKVSEPFYHTANTRTCSQSGKGQKQHCQIGNIEGLRWQCGAQFGPGFDSRSPRLAPVTNAQYAECWGSKNKRIKILVASVGMHLLCG